MTKTRQTTTSTDPVTEYAQQVLSGEVVAGPDVRNACERHIRDLKQAKDRGLFWDADAAGRFLGFCKNVLRLSEGQFEDTPFVPEPSQAFIAGSIFGWKRERDGKRRFRRAYIEQGKGNGKSPLAGAIGLYGLASDGEAGAQVYSAGATKDQAGILFADAVKMAKKSPALLRRLKFSGGEGREFNIAHLKSGSFFRPVSRETKKTGSGPRPHFALCDEVHEHPDGGVIEILERGFKFREQPLLLMITNSGSDRQSICWAERKHAVAVAAGDVEDDTTFAYVCSLDEGDDPFEDPSCWVKANPLLGVTITEEYLAGVVKQAKDIPAKSNGVKRLHFCQWTDAETAWISRAAWESCEDEDMSLEDFDSELCWGGLDLGALKDLAAKALVFPDGFTEDHKPKYAAFVHGYTPADTISARELSDGAPYREWVEGRFLTAVPGKKLRYSDIAQDLASDMELFGFEALAYDRWMFDRFEEELDELGLEVTLLEHPQGWNKRKVKGPDGKMVKDDDAQALWMPGSVDTLETLILEGRLRVHLNLALRSAVASATFEESAAGLRRFTKAKATGRIDMAVALAMAIGAATLGEQRSSASTPWDDDPDYRLAS